MGLTEAQKRYYGTPKGKATKKAADARYYDRHADELKGKALAAFHALSPQEKLERGRRNRAAVDPEVLRQSKRDENARVKLEVIQGYGGHCVCCGNDFMAHLTIDHIGGGGSQARKTEDARSLHRRLRREGFPDGYRVLCFNCNFGAHLNGGECGCDLVVTRGEVI